MVKFTVKGQRSVTNAARKAIDTFSHSVADLELLSPVEERTIAEEIETTRHRYVAALLETPSIAMHAFELAQKVNEGSLSAKRTLLKAPQPFTLELDVRDLLGVTTPKFCRICDQHDTLVESSGRDVFGNGTTAKKRRTINLRTIEALLFRNAEDCRRIQNAELPPEEKQELLRKVRVRRKHVVTLLLEIGVRPSKLEAARKRVEEACLQVASVPPDTQRESGAPESLGISPDELKEQVNRFDVLAAARAQAVHRMCDGNYRLVLSIAPHYQDRGLSYEDAVQEGNFGLLRAAELFECRRGFRFATFATYWIHQGILRAIADRVPMIRPPGYVHDSYIVVRRRAYDLAQQLQHSPTIEELAHEVEMKEENLASLMQLFKPTRSLDDPIGTSDDGPPLASFVCDNSAISAESRIDQELLRSTLRTLLRGLPSRMRAVLERRYGLGEDGRRNVLREIAADFNVGPERVRQIEVRAIRRLQAVACLEKLRDFFFVR